MVGVLRESPGSGHRRGRARRRLQYRRTLAGRGGVAKAGVAVFTPLRVVVVEQRREQERGPGCTSLLSSLLLRCILISEDRFDFKINIQARLIFAGIRGCA